jgi:hypothetical protein
MRRCSRTLALPLSAEQAFSKFAYQAGRGKSRHRLDRVSMGVRRSQHLLAPNSVASGLDLTVSAVNQESRNPHGFDDVLLP